MSSLDMAMILDDDLESLFEELSATVDEGRPRVPTPHWVKQKLNGKSLSGILIVCQPCQSVFESQENLETHYRFVHGHDRLQLDIAWYHVFMCQPHGYIFTDLDDILDHCRRLHYDHDASFLDKLDKVKLIRLEQSQEYASLPMATLPETPMPGWRSTKNTPHKSPSTSDKNAVSKDPFMSENQNVITGGEPMTDESGDEDEISVGKRSLTAEQSKKVKAAYKRRDDLNRRERVRRNAQKHACKRLKESMKGDDSGFFTNSKVDDSSRWTQIRTIMVATNYVKHLEILKDKYIQEKIKLRRRGATLRQTLRELSGENAPEGRVEIRSVVECDDGGDEDEDDAVPLMNVETVLGSEEDSNEVVALNCESESDQKALAEIISNPAILTTKKLGNGTLRDLSAEVKSPSDSLSDSRNSQSDDICDIGDTLDTSRVKSAKIANAKKKPMVTMQFGDKPVSNLSVVPSEDALTPSPKLDCVSLMSENDEDIENGSGIQLMLELEIEEEEEENGEESELYLVYSDDDEKVNEMIVV